MQGWNTSVCAHLDTCLLPIQTKAPLGLTCMFCLRPCSCHDGKHLVSRCPKLNQVCEDLNQSLKITCVAMRPEGYALGYVQVIPPNSTAKFPVIFQATKVQQYSQTVEYIVNGCHIFTFQVHLNMYIACTAVLSNQDCTCLLLVCIPCKSIMFGDSTTLPTNFLHAGTIVRQLSCMPAPQNCISVGEYH